MFRKTDIHKEKQNTFCRNKAMAYAFLPSMPQKLQKEKIICIVLLKLLFHFRMSCSLSELPPGCRLRGMGSTVQSGSLNKSLTGGQDSPNGALPRSQKPCYFCWCCCCNCSWLVHIKFHKNLLFIMFIVHLLLE